MSEGMPPINENDLHAYLDGQLDAERRLAVERYLDENPEDAQRMAAYGVHREAIRVAYAARAAEPLPAALSLAHIVAESHRRPRVPWPVAASIVLALGLGMASGWLLH